jgi:phytase-like protein
VLEKLNTPRAMNVVLAFVVFVYGFLLYHYWQELAKPPAGPPTKPPAAAATPRCRASEVVFLGYSDALDGYYYKGLPVGGLSGLTYDASRDLYYAVVDSQVGITPARFYAPKAPLEGGRLADPLISDVTVLRDPRGKPFTGANFDGEGLAVTREDELLIVSEVEPSILRFSLEGRFLGQLRVPQKFLVTPKGYAKTNASFESLELSPNERRLFTANERPLLVTEGKGADRDSSEEPQWVRLLTYQKNRGSSEFEPSHEFLYPVERGEGISEIAALSENELLILERQNRQIFRVSLDKAGAVPTEGGLASSGAILLEKELVVDVDDSCPLPSDGEDAFGLLEGMALGPNLPGGRRALLLQSDDNFGRAKSRMMMLGIPSR